MLDSLIGDPLTQENLSSPLFSSLLTRGTDSADSGQNFSTRKFRQIPPENPGRKAETDSIPVRLELSLKFDSWNPAAGISRTIVL